MRFETLCVDFPSNPMKRIKSPSPKDRDRFAPEPKEVPASSLSSIQDEMKSWQKKGDRMLSLLRKHQELHGVQTEQDED